MCDSGPVKSLQRMFSFCLFCFLFELGGSGVVLATPGISKLWFLHQFSVESIGTAPLSASCVHDPGGNPLLYHSSVLEAFAKLPLIISMHVRLSGDSEI